MGNVVEFRGAAERQWIERAHHAIARSAEELRAAGAALAEAEQLAPPRLVRRRIAVAAIVFRLTQLAEAAAVVAERVLDVRDDSER